MPSLVLALVLAQTYPDPVTNVGVSIGGPSSVTLTWTLPADPTVVGVTIYRERLDAWDDDFVFVLAGLQTTFTDNTAYADQSFRYWIHTRDAQGDLSAGAWVEVIGYGDFDDDDDHWDLICWASTAARPGPAPWLLVAAILGLLRSFRRAPHA
jgi:hypothetical protein